MILDNYKVGDVFRPIDRPDMEIEITSKRGVNAMNKHQPITYSDWKKFTRHSKKK